MPKSRILEGIRAELLDQFDIDTSTMNSSLRHQRLSEVSSHTTPLKCLECPVITNGDSDCLEPKAPCLRSLLQIKK
jgi:hypothetical protein